MSLYIIEDDDGNVLDNYGEFDNLMINAMLYDEPTQAERDVDKYGGHVVTLTEEQKVKLPREVGEELEDWKADNQDGYGGGLRDFCGDMHDDIFQMGLGRLISFAYKSEENYCKVLDAFRYGWEAEPEAKWYVQTPKEWREDSAIPEWMCFDTLRGVCSGFNNSGRTAFTRAELKQYHLDSDIFTLVPVGEDK